MTARIFLFLILAAVAHAQTVPPPRTNFRILYLDRPFTELEEKAIEEGKASRLVELAFDTRAAAGPGKAEKVSVPITRNQLSPPQTYTGTAPIRLQLAGAEGREVATIPVPAEGGDLLVLIQARQPGHIEDSSTLVIDCSPKQIPPGHLCVVNATPTRLAFRAGNLQETVDPGKHSISAPVRLRMNAVPVAMAIETKPAARFIFEGAIRLAPETRIVFLVFSPPGTDGIFSTDFFPLPGSP